MTKEELISRVAENIDNTNISKRSVACILEAINNEIVDAVASGETVYMRGFGCFSAVERKPKTVRDFKNNVSIKCPPHKVPKFKPYDDFTARVAG